MNDSQIKEIFSVRSGAESIASQISERRIRIKVITAGDVQIIKCYPVRLDYTQPRHIQHSGTRQPQKKLNDKNSLEKFRLLAYQNFTHGDFMVTLTFENEPQNRQKALESFRYLLKKLRKNTGADFKYLGSIESVDVNGVAVRFHIHLLLSGIDADTIKKAWIYGFVDVKRLDNLEGAAAYISKTFGINPISDEHQYLRSRNLKNPDIEVKTLDTRNLADSDELDVLITAPKEYIEENYPDYSMVGEPEIWTSEFIAGWYVRIELRKNDSFENRSIRRRNAFISHEANRILGIT